MPLIRRRQRQFWPVFLTPLGSAIVIALVVLFVLIGFGVGHGHAASVPLGWDYTQDPANPADGFIVYRCQGQNCTNFTPITPAPLSVHVLTYTDATLLNNAWYTWVVRATGKGVLSDPSNAYTFQTPPPPAPGKPAKPLNVRRMPPNT
jgi:hypothetical protein